MRFPWFLALLALPALLAGGLPRQAAADPACIEVANNTPYWMPGSIRGPNTHALGFRIDGNESRYVCLSLDVPKGTPLEVMIKSGMGIPVGTCDLPSATAGVRVQIDREIDPATQVGVVKIVCG